MKRLADLWNKNNRTSVVLVSAVLILVLALVDWLTKPYFSIGFLYLFPIMLAAGFLPRWVIVPLSVGCAVLSEVFSSLDPAGQSIRLIFEALAIAGCGMFVGELVRNRRLTSEANERLRILVETSPAAILTIDEKGFIEVANRAAAELIAPATACWWGIPSPHSCPNCILLSAVRKDRSFARRCSAPAIATMASISWPMFGSLLTKKARALN